MIHEGHQVWLTGVSARAVLEDSLRDGFTELITTATSAQCDAILNELPATLDPAQIVMTSLDGQSLEDALRERGITIDAIAIGASDEVVDPFGGVSDLSEQNIRTISSPEDVFREAPIRLLVVARLIATTGFEPSRILNRMAYRDAGNILDVHSDSIRWGQSMNTLLLGDFVDRGLEWLESTRLLALILPEIAAMVGFHKSCSLHHKDIWDHTKIVTCKTERNLVVRWSALCHDIGKVWTRSVSKQGQVHFFRHEDHGALLFESIAHRFGLSQPLTDCVAYVIRNHSRVNLYQEDWTDSAVRRLIRQTEGHLNDLLAFSKADYTTKNTTRIRQMERSLEDIQRRITEIRAHDAKKPVLNKGVGVAIMEHFQLRPSRTVGDLKQLLAVTIDEGKLPERADDSVYLEWLVNQPEAVARITEAGGLVQP